MPDFGQKKWDIQSLDGNTSHYFFWPISVKIEPPKCPENLFSNSEQNNPAQKYARFRSKIKMGYTKIGCKYFTLLYLADFGQNLTDQMP